MKIYKIEHDKFNYDAYLGYVIVANGNKEVREIAKKISADEGRNVWDKSKIVTEGEYTGEKEKPFIMLSNYMAG